MRLHVTGYYNDEYLYSMSREELHELQRIQSEQTKKCSKFRTMRVEKKDALKELLLKDLNNCRKGGKKDV